MSLPLYLDYAATTPVDVRVAEKMRGYLCIDGVFANPASSAHFYGWQAQEAVEAARRQVADALRADPREIVWTSGATEANNLAIKGAFEANHQDKGRHIVTTSIEHKAVLDTCEYLQKQGAEITWVAPEKDGTVSPEKVIQALREDTVLVSVMHANNETGVINDVTAIGYACREKGILFHVDAAQSAGKIPVQVGPLNVDLLSLSAHKFYGPKGIGALYVRRDPAVRIAAQMHGGGHERGMRSGTLPTHQVVGMGEALHLAVSGMADEAVKLASLRDQLWQGISQLPDVLLNGEGATRLPGHLNVAFAGVGGEVLLNALGQVAVSSGSACNSASMSPSYVLKAMGLEDELAHASIRFSLGRFVESAQIDQVIEHVSEVVTRLRRATG